MVAVPENCCGPRFCVEFEFGLFVLFARFDLGTYGIIPGMLGIPPYWPNADSEPTTAMTTTSHVQRRGVTKPKIVFS